VAERYASIPAQAEASTQILTAHFGLGDLLYARQRMEKDLDMVARVGTQHRLRFLAPAHRAILAYYFRGDWPTLAAELTRYATDPDVAQMPLGAVPAAYAILCHVRAGNEIEARRLLATLIPILESVDPVMYLHNVAVHLAAMSAWELGAAEYAATCSHLLSAVVAAGLGRAWWGPHELMLARMAALGGHIDEAGEYFAQARAWTEAQQHRYLAPIIDYDEALALVRIGAPDRPRIDALLAKALAAFRALETGGWEQRALALQDRAAASPAPPSTKPTYPDGLTAREVDVLRLLADGLTNKEIAQRLVLSVPTVARHIATIYNKIDARGRADATAYALRHGLASG
jgi:DNA-binding CsgD family transcriptional regulator